MALCGLVAWTGTASADFCGGGDFGESKPPMDEAWDLLQDEQPEEAKYLLIWAIRDGEIPGHRRPEAVLMLAEAQLRTGEWRPAIRNYRRGMELLGEPNPSARLGLAFAMYLGRLDGAAYAEAQAIAQEACGTPESARVPVCYGVHRLLARVGPRRDIRVAARARADRIRSERLVPWPARRGYNRLLRGITLTRREQASSRA